MKKLLLSLLLAFTTIELSAQGSGTPNTLRVKTDANGYLLAVSATQTNPVTQGTFSSRILKTDASGSLLVVLTGTVTPTYPMTIPASTCAAPSLGMSGGATTGIAFTATPSILNCISGTIRSTLTASLYTLDTKLLVNGTSNEVAAFTGTNPYITIGSASNTGGYIVFQSGSLEQRLHAGGGFTQLSSAQYLLSALSQVITRGSITTDIVTLDSTVTWNNAGVTFTGWKLNVTDTASAAASLLADLQIGGVSQFRVRKDGTVTITGSVIATSSGGSVNVASNGGVGFSGSSQINAPTNGLFRLLDNNSSFGTELNGGTAAPTVTSCGTGTVTTGSKNSTGEITATGATACTVTFGSPAFTNTPFCVVTLAVAPTTTPYISASSTTAFTVSGLTANDVFKYHCIGRIG